MSEVKYYVLSGEGSRHSFPIDPPDALSPVVWMDQDMVPGCMFNQACWFVKPCKQTGLLEHTSDELLMFIGNNPDDPEDLGAEIKIQLENDVLVLNHTCIVFVPAGVAHGNLEVCNMRRPVFHYSCHTNASSYEAVPATATAAVGTYAGYCVERYEPVGGRIPGAPEGFLKLLLWIDGKKLEGAPYMEAVWFLTKNFSGPEPHVHDFDEFIGFMGSDPASPEDLGAEVHFFLGEEEIVINKSCLFYIPRGVCHSPITVPNLEHPIFHFSGGNGGDYVRKETV